QRDGEVVLADRLDERPLVIALRAHGPGIALVAAVLPPPAVERIPRAVAVEELCDLLLLDTQGRGGITTGTLGDQDLLEGEKVSDFGTQKNACPRCGRRFGC